MYEDLAWAARNVIEEGGDGWWGSDQLGEEKNSWIPEVDCEFIHKASPVVILGLLKDLENLKSLNEGLEVLVDVSQNKFDRMRREIDRLQQDLAFEKQLNNKQEERY